MNAIEKHLHEHFASLQETEDVTPAARTGAGMMGDSVAPTLDEPFARVNSVVPSSPAYTAGLKAGDEIRNFGYVNKGNHDGLKKVAECVQGNENVSYHFGPDLTLERRTADRNGSKTSWSRSPALPRLREDKSFNSTSLPDGIGAAEACWDATSCQCEQVASHSIGPLGNASRS
jgi:hypothetical protein